MRIWSFLLVIQRPEPLQMAEAYYEIKTKTQIYYKVSTDVECLSLTGIAVYVNLIVGIQQIHGMMKFTWGVGTYTHLRRLHFRKV